MKIINAMFAKGLGGIEQAFIDYTKALQLAGHEVICVTHPDAKINSKLKEIEGIKSFTITNAGQWDIFAKFILFGLVKHQKADAIIAHGNRAIALFKMSRSHNCPIIGVAHNYSVKKFRRLDAAFTVTEDLKHYLENKTRIKSQLIFNVPNMIYLPEQEPEYTPFRNTVILGTAARHVKKKSLDILIKAAGRLRDMGANFQLYIGGIGKETTKLQELRDNLGLSEYIRFIGWVENKENFYSNIDIFVLPSKHEPFGIVVLEALAHKKPLVTTECEGPKEIIRNGYDALSCPVDDVEALAEKLYVLINNPQLAEQLANNGYDTVSKNYNLNVVSDKIKNALEVVKATIK